MEDADAPILQHLRQSRQAIRRQNVWAVHDERLDELTRAGLLSAQPNSFQPAMPGNQTA